MSSKPCEFADDIVSSSYVAFPPQIWLGNLVSVINELKIEDDKTLKRVMELLDFQFGVAGLSSPKSARRHLKERGSDETVVPQPADELPSPKTPLITTRKEVPTLEPQATNEDWTAPAGWRDVVALEPVEKRHHEPHLPYCPLFSEIASTPILAASIATNGPGGPINVEPLVELVARAQPITEIPRQPRPSLFRGVRVLADINPMMEPFMRDQQQLIEQLRGLVGYSMVEVEWYDASPMRRCGTGSVGTWKPFAPPHSGTPVLVLGDLGIGDSQDDVEADWLELADLLVRRESALVALVPYPASRWPVNLIGAVDIVVWDRSTDINDIIFRLRP